MRCISISKKASLFKLMKIYFARGNFLANFLLEDDCLCQGNFQEGFEKVIG